MLRCDSTRHVYTIFQIRLRASTNQTPDCFWHGNGRAARKREGDTAAKARGREIAIAAEDQQCLDRGLDTASEFQDARDLASFTGANCGL